MSLIYIDNKNPQPIYEQLVYRIKTLIYCNAMKSGEKLPSIRQLAATLAINPNTIQKAYDILEKEGYIINCVGRGCFVTDNIDVIIEKRKDEIKENLTNLFENAVKFGLLKNEIVALLDEIYSNNK